MQMFASVKEAKEFLVGTIAEEASLHGEALSEIERKMLFFSETGWTLPEMDEVAAAFDATCDQPSYERRIAGLIRDFLKRAKRDDADRMGLWRESVAMLRHEDHYLLVLIGIADGAYNIGAPLEERSGWMRIWNPLAIGLVLGIIIVVTCFVLARFL